MGDIVTLNKIELATRLAHIRLLERYVIEEDTVTAFDITSFTFGLTSELI